jgi:hypothetical protein
MGDYFTYQEPTPFIETFLFAIAILVFFILIGWILRIIFQEISMQLTIGRIKSKKSIKDFEIPQEILDKHKIVSNKNPGQQNSDQKDSIQENMNQGNLNQRNTKKKKRDGDKQQKK